MPKIVTKYSNELMQAIKEFTTIQNDCDNFDEVNIVCNRAIERIEQFLITPLWKKYIP